jgi:ABC-type transport system substrate-binding protein
LGSDVHTALAQSDAAKMDVPRYDPKCAKKLQAEAGYPNGLEVDFSTQEARAEPAMAQGLKKSAAAAGFNINLKILPSAQYWDNWTY